MTVLAFIPRAWRKPIPQPPAVPIKPHTSQSWRALGEFAYLNGQPRDGALNHASPAARAAFRAGWTGMRDYGLRP